MVLRKYRFFDMWGIESSLTRTKVTQGEHSGTGGFSIVCTQPNHQHQLRKELTSRLVEHGVGMLTQETASQRQTLVSCAISPCSEHGPSMAGQTGTLG